MGMGMAEGEWAAKRGLPAPTLAGERAGSLGGRQATSRRSVEAVSISNSFPPSSVSCRNSPALPALGCFQTLGSRFLIWALAAAAAPRVVSLSCTSEHSGSLGKCSSCTVGQYSLAPRSLPPRCFLELVVNSQGGYDDCSGGGGPRSVRPPVGLLDPGCAKCASAAEDTADFGETHAERSTSSVPFVMTCHPSVSPSPRSSRSVEPSPIDPGSMGSKNNFRAA